MDDKTTEQVNNVPNPTGKGGFEDHPENRNNGGRYPRSESFTYWMEYFKAMSVSQFLEWEKLIPDTERTVAQDLAYRRVFNSRKNLKEFKEVANRTEGMPIKRTEVTGADGGQIDVLLNQIERTNYDDVARKAKEQMVEVDQPVQNPQQEGGVDNLQTERHTTTPPSGEGQPQIQPNTES